MTLLEDSRHQAGFTLVEAIIAMVVTGIVAAIVSVFIAGPIQGYVDTTRRAGLTDTADTALRRIAYELRSAVPNSVRIHDAGRSIEFIPTRDGGIYRAQRDAAGCAVASPSDPIADVDDCSAADNARFDVLGPPVAGSAGDFVVIYNTGQAGLDAYEGGSGRNRRTVTAAGAKVAFTPTATVFPTYESPFQRFQIVPSTGPITFGCSAVAALSGSGGFELRRITAYRGGTDDWTPSPLTAAGSSAVLATELDSCAFSYQPVSATNGLVVLRLVVRRDGESITLVSQVHVDNTP